MLQVILSENDKYSVAEQAQMAIEGGASWLELRLSPDKINAIREEIADEIIPMCRDNGTFLTVTDNVQAAKDFNLHGVFVTDKNINVPALRDELGPEAIIGATVADPQAARMLENADIDFVRPTLHMSDTEITKLVAAVRDAGGLIPIVAEGRFDASNARQAMGTGVSGLASGPVFFDADDPVNAISQTIKILENE